MRIKRNVTRDHQCQAEIQKSRWSVSLTDRKRTSGVGAKSKRANAFGVLKKTMTTTDTQEPVTYGQVSPVVICEWCEEPLTKEEAESHVDGKPICCSCDYEHNYFTCHWCENYEEKELECKIGSLFAVFEPTPARNNGDALLWFDAQNHEMLPGLYRIIKWPMYGDAVLDQWLCAESFERVCDLTDEMKENGGYGEYPCGPLCRECGGAGYIEGEKRRIQHTLCSEAVMCPVCDGKKTERLRP